MPSFRYLATFAAGFEGIVPSYLARVGASGVGASGGAALFRLPGPVDAANRLSAFSNVFLIVAEYRGRDMNFARMVRGEPSRAEAIDPIARELARRGVRSFRVRFSREGRFESVEPRLVAEAEAQVREAFGVRDDRTRPDAEFWYMIRRDGGAYFLWRLTDRPEEERDPAPGELRADLARLIVAHALDGIDDPRAALDPFAGSGALPRARAELCPAARVLASDSDPAKVASMRSRLGFGVEVFGADARSLPGVADGSIDLVVTDPPWGDWDAAACEASGGVDGLYRGFLAALDRVLSSNGRACVLTGAKTAFEAAVAASPEFAASAGAPGFRTDVLVNGKKAALYRLSRA